MAMVIVNWIGVVVQGEVYLLKCFTSAPYILLLGGQILLLQLPQLWRNSHCAVRGTNSCDAIQGAVGMPTTEGAAEPGARGRCMLQG